MPIKTATKEIAGVLGLNGVILRVTTFTDLEVILKLLLLVVSIVYTIDKWLYHKKKRNEEKKIK